MAKTFLTKWQKATTDVGRYSLADKYPGVYFARSLKEASGPDDRFVLEARVLANQPAEVIAGKMHTTPEVVFWYEKLFFDVRSNLHRRDWLVNRVLGPSFHRGVKAREFDLLLKLYALTGGPAVIDALVEGSALVINQPVQKKDVQAFFIADKMDTLARQGALAARCMPVLSETQALVLDAHHKAMSLEAELKSSNQGPQSAWHAGADMVLKALVFRSPEEQAAAPTREKKPAGRHDELFKDFKITESLNGKSGEKA
ncbi:MAG: hypothetical protein E6G97_18020 [Alphaproteobacteria bacterium]|nr:MAG: hypothetical protein E6G97_18020 [Alphaproteobacteria bacterium]